MTTYLVFAKKKKPFGLESGCGQKCARCAGERGQTIAPWASARRAPVFFLVCIIQGHTSQQAKEKKMASLVRPWTKGAKSNAAHDVADHCQHMSK
jgi:hypothetical protein